MEKKSTVFLQAVVLLIGIVALVLLIWFPLTEGRAAHLNLFRIYADPLILYAYVASLAFFSALYNAFRLLGYIGRREAFTLGAVKTLKNIKYCAIVLGVLIVLAGVFIRFAHSKEDDPAGFIAICIITTFVAIVVATAAAIFQRILQHALDLKSENELTV